MLPKGLKNYKNLQQNCWTLVWPPFWTMLKQTADADDHKVSGAQRKVDLKTFCPTTKRPRTFIVPGQNFALEVCYYALWVFRIFWAYLIFVTGATGSACVNFFCQGPPKTSKAPKGPFWASVDTLCHIILCRTCVMLTPHTCSRQCPSWCTRHQCVTKPKIWTIPIPRLFSVPNISGPIPGLFSISKIFETDSETFFRY